MPRKRRSTIKSRRAVRIGRKGGTVSVQDNTSKIGIGLIGAAFGAAVGAASAVALSDKNVRKKVADTLGELRYQAVKITETQTKTEQGKTSRLKDRTKEKPE